MLVVISPSRAGSSSDFSVISFKCKVKLLLPLELSRKIIL